MPFNTTLKPAQIEIIAKPGTAFTQAYDVTNNSNSPMVISASVLPWHPVDNDGAISYQNVEPSPNYTFSLANADIKLGQSFILKAGQKQQLVLKVKTNSDTDLGDGYFTFFINQDQSGQLNSDTSGGQVTARLGSHLLVSTSDTENPHSNLKITQVITTPRLADTFFPKIHITGTINNDSEYFTKTTGKLTISKGKKTIDEIDLFPHNVLAHSSRNISCLSGNEPTNCILHPPFWPGIYTATISLDQPNTPVLTTTFFVFPFSILLFIILTGSFVYSIVRKAK